MSASDEKHAPSRIEGDAGLREEAIAWVVRLHNSRLTEDDRLAFENWKSQSPAHDRTFQHISSVWGDSDLHAAAIQSTLTNTPLNAVRTSSATSSWRRIAAPIAACALVFALTGAYFDVMTWMKADYQTAVGEQQTLILPDQSIITLNTQSAVTTAFDATARRVRLLKGEVLFTVQSDARRPFIVESPHAATRAVGTKFIVRAHEHLDRITVLEGTVEVRNRSDHDAASLVSAGLTIDSEPAELSPPVPVDLQMANSWVRGRLVVDGVPLEQVLDEVRRYYPGTIQLWNQDLRQTLVTGTFNLEEPSKTLDLLVNTLPIKMVNAADLVVILY